MRYFNVYGPRCTTGQYSGVMGRFAGKLTIGRPLEIFGDGSQRRNFVYVTDVVEANMKFAESMSAVGKTFNIGTGKMISIIELAEIFSNEMGGQEKCILYHEAGPGEINHSGASIQRTRKAIRYTQLTEISEEIDRFISWYKAK